MATTRASSPTPADAACPHCGRPRRWVSTGAFGAWEPCRCPGALAEEARAASEEAARAEESRVAASHRRYRRAGIPEAWWAQEPDDLALGIVDRARAGRGTWLIGDVGLGKTRAAMVAARVLLDSSVEVYGSGSGAVWVPSLSVTCLTDAELLDSFRDTFRRGGPSGGEVASRLASVDLLVVDDLGKTAPTPWNLTQLFRVVDGRYGAGLPVVVTSQVGPDRLIDQLSAEGGAETAKAMVSRLCGMCDRMALAGPDRRLGGSL